MNNLKFKIFKNKLDIFHYLIIKQLKKNKIQSFLYQILQYVNFRIRFFIVKIIYKF